VDALAPLQVVTHYETTQVRYTIQVGSAGLEAGLKEETTMTVPEYLRARADLMAKLFTNSPEATGPHSDITRLRQIADRWEYMENALDGLYSHTKHNCQIAGLNSAASAALDVARAPLKED